MLNTFKILFILLSLLSGSLIGSLSAQQFTDVAVELAVADTGIFPVGGVFWVDYDADGWLDLYVVNRSSFLSPFRPIPNRLYKNLGNGMGFRDVADEVGAQVLEGQSWVAAWGDFDQDGNIEIFVQNGDPGLGSPTPENTLLSYNGEKFIDIAPQRNLDWITAMISLNIVDFDNDGDLDIFGSSVFTFRNLLFRNDGATFHEVGMEVGIDDSVNSPYNFKSRGGSAWGDFDNDGDMDLYICRASISNLLFRNDMDIDGRFVEIAEEMGVADVEPADTSPSWVDYDNDGDLDLLVVSNVRGGGNLPDKRLYRNDLNIGGTFSDVAQEIGMDDSTRAWSLSWTDFDNDGDLDLYTTSKASPDILYRNDISTNEGFTDITEDAGISSLISDNYFPTWGDYDNDGDMDLYVANFPWISDYDENFLYRNDQNDDNYLFVRVLASNGSYSRHGSRVWIYKANTDSLIGMREVDGHSGRNVQNQYDLHFGLDPNKAYDIVVRFTTRINGENIVFDKNIFPELGNVIPININGFIEVRDTVAIDSIVTGVSVEDEPKAVLPRSVTLYQNFPNPFNPVTTISFFLPNSGKVTLTIYNMLGEEVTILQNGFMQAGDHRFNWDASKMASGIYIYRLTSGNFVATRKMVLLK